MDHKVVTDYTRVSACEHVKVFVRARPCADGSEPFDGMFERKRETPKNITIKDVDRSQYGEHAFSFDNIFWTETTQEEVFESCSKPLVDYALRGINSCCFAYGQTGSGKTYSIFGETGEKDGMIPRAADYLFEMIEANSNTEKQNKPVYTLVVSFLEIYCDRIRDLGREYVLSTNRAVSLQQSSGSDWYLRNKMMKRTDSSASMHSTGSGKDEPRFDYERENLEIHEDAQGMVYVKDLSMIEVSNREEVNAIVQMGLTLRATHETKMNSVSSRSHTVFTIHIFQHDVALGQVMCGMMNLVDLAGSERLKKSESDGQRLKEALHINSSLSAVGKVVMSLDPESGFNYIPYRDSKLTRLLQNSIGGNSYTLLIATIHPMKEHYEECLNTMQFANRCRMVQNQPRVNYINQSGGDKDKRIRKLLDEIAMLNRKLEHIKSEQNQRMSNVLRELGYDVKEYTEDGNVRLMDGTLLMAQSPDAVLDMQGNPITYSLGDEATMGRRSSFDTGRNLEMRRAIDFLRKERDHMKQKADDVKNVVLASQVELKREKDELQRQLQQHKKEIARLESVVQEKDLAMDRIQAAGNSKHKEEIQHILAHTSDLKKHLHVQFQEAKAGCTLSSMAASAQQSNLAEQFQQRALALEKCKQEDIALVKQQYDCLLTRKRAEYEELSTMWRDKHAQTSHLCDTLKEEMADLYAYTSRLFDVAQNHGTHRGSDGPWPKAILTNPNKLRTFKALLGSDPAVRARVASDKKVPLKGPMSPTAASRPVSAPVRRPMSAGFATALRGRVVQHTSHAMDRPDEEFPERTEDDVDLLSLDELRQQVRRQRKVPIKSEDTALATLKARLDDEIQKNRSLRATNAALKRQQDKIAASHQSSSKGHRRVGNQATKGHVKDVRDED
ncbi:hypothetical protein, variant 1 [Aphanomyces invadans]|uniref:Kinesin-like protein n=1 Tax=Aphanomyces invadans TaxID=157072 RepID=A0A024UQJ1_9STRA|nr:hypothetical protein, variant 1 [Aphanomyces invadans]ETW08726.1 hypothetical protein, variant 1 [Aphanomyces invadans]|eukprot:XP_008862531.1 hypothetical protein, variant 1 [Aphanomyces invadans]